MSEIECYDCGDLIHPGTPCRTVEEILAELAPPPGCADRMRAERAASIARADAVQDRIYGRAPIR